jgi:hypothetical protein
MAICGNGSFKRCDHNCLCRVAVLDCLVCLECGRNDVGLLNGVTPKCRHCGSTLIDLLMDGEELPAVVDYRVRSVP